MSDESWGPWVEHDGKGCPCKGQFVQLESFDGKRWLGVAGIGVWSSVDHPQRSAWAWATRTPSLSSTKRYRVRKPRQASTETGMAVLREILDRETAEPVSKPVKVRP